MQTFTKYNYKNQNGCHNCKKNFVCFFWEEEPIYYCTLDKENRPLCGSACMNESWFKPDGSIDDSWIQKQMAWEEWSKDNQVNPYGICDKYEQLLE